MSWIDKIFDRLNLHQLKLLLWFLDDQHGKYVESNGVRFEWCDGRMVISAPTHDSIVAGVNLIASDAFRAELRSQIGRLAQEETRS